MSLQDRIDADIKAQKWNNGRAEHTTEARAKREAAEYRESHAKEIAANAKRHNKWKGGSESMGRKQIAKSMAKKMPLSDKRYDKYRLSSKEAASFFKGKKDAGKDAVKEQRKKESRNAYIFS